MSLTAAVKFLFMELDLLLLSRLQFALTIMFHYLFRR